MTVTDLHNPAIISGIVGSLSYFSLMILLLINWRGQVIGGLLLFSSLVTSIWFATIVYENLYGGIGIISLHVIEFMRNISWLTLLIMILTFGLTEKKNEYSEKFFAVLVSIFNFILTVIVLVYVNIIPELMSESVATTVVYFFYLVLAILGLTLLEKIYKSTRKNKKWSIKHLCLGLGVVFLYDFFLYSDAMLFKSINMTVWDTRGFINSLAVPLIAVTVVRNPQWNIQIFVSRHVVYRSVVFISSGIYLLLMAAAGLYIKVIGGTWGNLLQLAFFVGAIIILFVIMVSEKIRSSIKVILVKHFYKNKYDYRQEWLNYTSDISQAKNQKNSYEIFIASICNIIKSNGGALWIYDDKKNTYAHKCCFGNMPRINYEVSADDALIAFIEDKNWILKINDNKTGEFSHLHPDWFSEIPNAWLLLPLIHSNKLIGFMIFQESSVKKDFDWEDADLLKTVGFQTASFITSIQLTESLSQAKQFEAFNRLSAFVVHDIKNLIAQLSLISINAAKYRNNQAFVDDSFETIKNATQKMKRLLRNLAKGEVSQVDNSEKININTMIKDILKSRNDEQIHIEKIDEKKYCTVLVDKDKLTSVIEHLLQNAKEATSENGRISIIIRYKNDRVCIDVSDDGVGMEQNFIDNRLFKPFDTTKGNAGMGIGLYESQEYLAEMGGKITVQSQLNIGSTFTVSLPLFQIEYSN